MTWLFVDGYNVIGAWPELSALRDEHLEEARRTLIDILKEFAATTDYHVVLVFDGYKVKGGRGTREDGKYLTVLFTSEGVTADMAIERLVAELPKHADVYVASSDRLVQEIILGQGGLRISAAELRHLVMAEHKVTRRRMQREESPSPLDSRLDAATRARLQALINETEKKRKKP